MTTERLTQLQADPRIAVRLAYCPLSCLTAMTIHLAARFGLLTAAEMAVYQ